MSKRLPIYLRRFGFLLVLTFILNSWCLLCGVLRAEEKVVPSERGLTEVEVQSEVHIDRANALEFQSKLPAELYPMVRAGQFEFVAAKSLSYSWLHDDQWRVNSGSLNLDLPLSFSSFPPNLIFPRGFLFGAAEKVLQDQEPERRASKILWNIVSHFWSQRGIRANFRLMGPDQSENRHEFRGQLARVYPHSLSASDKTSQVFRELIRFESPSFLKDLSWLTFRFFGDEEDVLWVYSPAIRAVRELTGSNRSDAMVRSVVSPDDFLVWSGKPELVEAVFDQEALLFAPYVSTKLLTWKPTEGDCATFTLKEQIPQLAEHGLWNFENSRWPHAAGWLPSAAFFVPRQLLRLELAPKDPYSLYGRQIIYVDKEAILPVYKFVYNRAGKLWKTVMGSFVFLASPDRKERVAFPAFNIVVDHTSSQTFVIEFDSTSYCSSSVAGLEIGSFDPKQLLPGDLEKVETDKP
ncbi:MAG: outer membrane lipoprotein-sorting protein [Bdellovibrionales bacterium]|nr:outer membrane lipoprotein-sorting protein [Bdellovibrionales bacterium]